MIYTAGEAAKILGIPASTIRYYDKEGLLPAIERSVGGIRMFKEEDFTALRLIQCLKSTGLSLKDIREFIQLPPDGEETIRVRLSILKKQKAIIVQKQKELEEMASIVDYKLWFYETAKDAGTTETPNRIDKETLPQRLKDAYQKLHELPPAE